MNKVNKHTSRRPCAQSSFRRPKSPTLTLASHLGSSLVTTKQVKTLTVTQGEKHSRKH